jgi:hypothetical protein
MISSAFLSCHVLHCVAVCKEKGISAGLGVGTLLNNDWVRKLEKYLENISQTHFHSTNEKHTTIAYSIVSLYIIYQ